MSSDPKPGAVRYKDSNGDVVTTNPHDPLYSSALFAADEVFTDNGWEPIEGPAEREIFGGHLC